ncbi:MAG TPA: hypothetical protein VGF16_16270 [Bryobacteraceae bacterium]
MKQLLVLLSISGALLGAQDLANVHSVYLLPMAHGMDQHLANRLTQEHVFQVVTTLKSADAVFTDRIGEAFESELAEARGNADAVKPPAEANKSPEPPEGNSSAPLPPPGPKSTFGQGKGTVFLVDPKSHRVLWSAYRPAKSSSSDDLNRTASDIVSRLERDLKTK